jgi:hypothetical protein
MARFFYTAPLAAAWMAKHFGMEFLLEGGVEVDDAGEFAYFNSSFHGKLYVHPDSLPLLRVRKDDIVQFTEEAVNNDRDGYTTRFGLYSGLNIPIEVEKVMQRNGIPFNWPDYGAAANKTEWV